MPPLPRIDAQDPLAALARHRGRDPARRPPGGALAGAAVGAAAPWYPAPWPAPGGPPPHVDPDAPATAVLGPGGDRLVVHAPEARAYLVDPAGNRPLAHAAAPGARAAPGATAPPRGAAGPRPQRRPAHAPARPDEAEQAYFEALRRQRGVAMLPPPGFAGVMARTAAAREVLAAARALPRHGPGPRPPGAAVQGPGGPPPLPDLVAAAQQGTHVHASGRDRATAAAVDALLEVWGHADDATAAALGQLAAFLDACGQGDDAAGARLRAGSAARPSLLQRAGWMVDRLAAGAFGAQPFMAGAGALETRPGRAAVPLRDVVALLWRSIDGVVEAAGAAATAAARQALRRAFVAALGHGWMHGPSCPAGLVQRLAAALQGAVPQICIDPEAAAPPTPTEFMALVGHRFRALPAAPPAAAVQALADEALAEAATLYAATPAAAAQGAEVEAQMADFVRLTYGLDPRPRPPAPGPEAGPGAPA